MEKYINEHNGRYKGFESFNAYLDYIFSQGEIFYKASLDKGKISYEACEKKKKEEILKKLKANQ